MYKIILLNEIKCIEIDMLKLVVIKEEKPLKCLIMK